MDTGDYDRPDDFNGPSKRVDIRQKIACKVLRLKTNKIKKTNRKIKINRHCKQKRM